MPSYTPHHFSVSDLRAFFIPESPWCPECSCAKNGDGDTPNVVQYEDDDGDHCLNEDCRCHGVKCDECGEHCTRAEMLREERCLPITPCECCAACRRDTRDRETRYSFEASQEARFDSWHDGGL